MVSAFSYHSDYISAVAGGSQVTTLTTWLATPPGPDTVAASTSTRPSSSTAPTSTTSTGSSSTTALTSTTSTTSTGSPYSTIPSPNPSSSNAASTQNQTSSDVSSGDGHSTGALAGGIIGGVIAGAIFAFLLTFFIMSRRRRKHDEDYSPDESKKHDGSAPPGHETADAPLIDPRRAWELHLPQPADDTKLHQGVKTLYDRLELHVENFYTDSPATSSPQASDDNEWSAALQKLGTPYLPAPIESLLQQARATTVVIKHCLTYLVISGIDAHTDGPFSFLPEEVTAVPRGAVRGDKSRPAFAQALAHHSQLTLFLLAPLPTTLPQYAGHRDAIIATAVNTFCTAFAPWAAASSTAGARSENLIQILLEASDLGLMLCRQPSIFEWRWKTSRDTRKVTIAPAFVRAHSEGRTGTTAMVELVETRVRDI